MNENSLTTRRGKLTLLLLCAVAFMDFVDGAGASKLRGPLNGRVTSS